MQFLTQYGAFVGPIAANRAGGSGFASSSRNVHASTPGYGGGFENAAAKANVAIMIMCQSFSFLPFSHTEQVNPPRLRGS